MVKLPKKLNNRLFFIQINVTSAKNTFYDNIVLNKGTAKEIFILRNNYTSLK